MAGAPPRTQQIVTIVTMIAMLVFVLTMQKSCAHGTAHFLGNMDVPSDGGR